MYAGKKQNLPLCASCSLCAQDIRANEKRWYCNGVTVCADCFLQFAREELKPFEYLPGEERTE